MKTIDKLLLLEVQVKNWMNTHRIKMLFIASFLGIVIGVGGGLLLDAPLNQIAIMSLGYASILTTCELVMGGENN